MLVSTKTKEYFFGRHLCIRSIARTLFALCLIVKQLIPVIARSRVMAGIHARSCKSDHAV